MWWIECESKHVRLELIKNLPIPKVRQIPDSEMGEVRTSGRRQGRQSLVTFKIPPEEVNRYTRTIY